MMRKYLFKPLYVIVLTALVWSCDVFDMEVEQDPNNLAPDVFNEDIMLVEAQLDLAEMFEEASEFTMEVVRMQHMFGPLYLNAYGPATFDDTWEFIYREIMIDLRTAVPVFEEKGKLHHIAVAQVIEAYALMMGVDMFGDIPYTEAALGEGNINPSADPGSAVYQAAINLLLSAKENFNTPVGEGLELEPAFDYYYSGTDPETGSASWVRLVNTLLVRAYVNTRLVDSSAGNAIQAILDEVDGVGVIDEPSEDFEFKWSTNRFNPDSRHPKYGLTYDNGPAGIYMNNYYMALFYRDYNDYDGVVANDPRRIFYFFRQSTGYSNDPLDIPCLTAPTPNHYNTTSPIGPGDTEGGTPFCIDELGYWGRDHGNPGGIPPDDGDRTVYGNYPVGGRIDLGQDEGVTAGEGLNGAGISPIVLSSFTHFMLAEATLEMGVNVGVDARTLMAVGVRQSIDKAISFGQLDPEAVSAAFPTEDEIQGYIDVVTARYDSSADPLEIVIREYYKAAWGNGFEPYNAYRRTGYPEDLQPLLEPNFDSFINTFLYPNSFVNRNNTVTQKGVTERVFWDDGSATLD